MDGFIVIFVNESVTASDDVRNGQPGWNPVGAAIKRKGGDADCQGHEATLILPMIAPEAFRYS